MAQWDGIGDTYDWGEYFAGRRRTKPAAQLDAQGQRSAWEWAAAMMKNDKDRAKEFADYLAQYDIGEVTR